MVHFPHGRILLSSPREYDNDSYDVTYSINAWMNPGKNKVDKLKAFKQWQTLRNTISRLGASVDVIHVPFPDGVFAANAGLVHQRQFVLSTFKHGERRPEESHWLQWARSLDHPNNPFDKFFTSIHIINNAYFEGAGDALFVGDTLACGYGFRTDYKATQIIGNLLNVPVVPLRLVNEKFYHLDTCFCPLDNETVMFYPGAFFDPQLIRDQFKTIEVSQADVYMFACNAVVLGKDVILPKGCDHTGGLLKKHGFEPHQIDMNEYMKSGGACKCLTLRYV